jgi:signal transduction histidine kinase
VSSQEIAQQEKKAALMQSIWATYILIPFLWLVLVALKSLGYEVGIEMETLLMGPALAAAFIANLCVVRGWLIDQLYSYLYSAILSLIVVAAVYWTGNIVSPFVWIGLFIVIYDVIAYSPLKGVSVAIFFVVSLWLIALAEMTGLMPSLPIMPELRVIENGKYILLMLVSNSMLFGLITSAVVFISDRMRQEKTKALASARESAEAYSASVKIMKDLNDSHRQLQEQVQELEQARAATLHLLRDVRQARKDADQKTLEMAKLYDQLKSIDKMKTEFLSVISHELRTPLTPIMGYATMFLNEQFGGLAPEYKERADLIKKESEHLLGIIDSILDVSRLERGISLAPVKEPISIGAILAGLVEVMSPEFGEREMKVGIDLPPDFPVVMGDADKIRRLLTNILGNAVHFTPKGGSVTIRGEQKADHIELSISDSGIGIARENLPRIFEKFYQVDGTYTRAVGGVGLGLAIAKEIAAAHGGRIWAESPGLGRGTTIKLTLPIQ